MLGTCMTQSFKPQNPGKYELMLGKKIRQGLILQTNKQTKQAPQNPFSTPQNCQDNQSQGKSEEWCQSRVGVG